MLQSERLTLRDVTVEDVPLIHQLNSIPEVDKYNTLGLPENLDQTKTLVEKWIAEQQTKPQKQFVFTILKEEQNFIGLLGLHLGKEKYNSAEIWYKIHPEYWNKGYATETVECVLNFCFTELKLHRVTAGCATENTASIRVLEKNRFIKEAHHRK